MTTTMIRVRSDIHTHLRDLAREQGISMQEVLARALEDYRRALMFERASQEYAALRADPQAWAEELRERALWDRTSMDGLEPAPQRPSSGDIYDVEY